MTFYDELEVSKTATVEVIQAAYRSLAKRYHPDRNPGDTSAAERTRRVNEAYAVLSDAEKRAVYDATLAAAEHRRSHATQAQANADHAPLRQSSCPPDPPASSRGEGVMIRGRCQVGSADIQRSVQVEDGAANARAAGPQRDEHLRGNRDLSKFFIKVAA